jgi:hypothetical protein
VRSFNTADPCDPFRHYMLPPESRLPSARTLVEGSQCFIVRAPRQTGKTTTMWALAQQLTDGGSTLPWRSPARPPRRRDVRDYKAASGGAPSRLGTAGPFNIAVESLRIGDFSFEEVAALYQQRTTETGQEFSPEAVQLAFAYSQGQPWLVNALAREITFKMEVGPPAPITTHHIETARERLILARESHLDSLVSKLAEPRVRRVIEPLLAGTLPPKSTTSTKTTSHTFMTSA